MLLLRRATRLALPRLAASGQLLATCSKLRWMSNAADDEDVWLPNSFADIPLTDDLSIDYPKPKDCPPVPRWFKGAESGIPVAIETRRTIEAGSPAKQAPGDNKVVLTTFLDDVDLDLGTKKNLIEIVGARYNPNTRILKLTSDKYMSPDENSQHCIDMLKQLIAEAKTMNEAILDASQATQ